MEVSNNVNLTAGLFSFSKAKDVKNEEVLSALGMTPQTQKAQNTIDESIKQGVAMANGQGANLDLKA